MSQLKDKKDEIYSQLFPSSKQNICFTGKFHNKFSQKFLYRISQPLFRVYKVTAAWDYLNPREVYKKIKIKENRSMRNSNAKK